MSIIDGTGKLPPKLPEPPTLPGTVTVVQKVYIKGDKGDKGDPGDPGPPGPGVDIPAPPFSNAIVQQRTDGTFFSGRMTIDQLLPPYAIELSGGGNVEVGTVVTNPAFTAEYTRDAASSVIADDQGNFQDVTGTPTSFTFLQVYSYSDLFDVDFFLTANESGGPSKESNHVKLRFLKRLMWGYLPTGQDLSDLIAGLGTTTLKSGRSSLLTNVQAGALNKVWIFYPMSFGLASFKIGGFAGGMLDPITYSYENPLGVTENFYAYESLNYNIGASSPTTVEID